MPVDFEERIFYGKVKYYFVHEYGNTISMLAYIMWVRDQVDSGHGIRCFRNWGAQEVVHVSAIDRCVGFFKLANNRYAIIDCEGQVAL